MVLFGGFFGAAIAYRRRPEIHKRLIMLATVALLFAAIGRMPGPVPLRLFIWVAPVLVAIGYEAVRRRRLDRIYGVGLVILLVAPARLALMQWAPWVRMMRTVLQSLM